MLQQVVSCITDVAPSPCDDNFIAGEGEMFDNREHTVVLSTTSHMMLPDDV